MYYAVERINEFEPLPSKDVLITGNVELKRLCSLLLLSWWRLWVGLFPTCFFGVS